MLAGVISQDISLMDKNMAKQLYSFALPEYQYAKIRRQLLLWQRIMDLSDKEDASTTMNKVLMLLKLREHLSQKVVNDEAYADEEVVDALLSLASMCKKRLATLPVIYMK